MKLVTKCIEKKFEKYPLYSQDGKGVSSKLLVKFFNPYGAGTWLITEAEKLDNGDYRLFGLINIHNWEWGYVLLSELENLRINVCGYSLPIERDIYAGKFVKDELSESELKEVLGCENINDAK